MWFLIFLGFITLLFAEFRLDFSFWNYHFSVFSNLKNSGCVQIAVGSQYALASSLFSEGGGGCCGDRRRFSIEKYIFFFQKSCKGKALSCSFIIIFFFRFCPGRAAVALIEHHFSIIISAVSVLLLSVLVRKNTFKPAMIGGSPGSVFAHCMIAFKKKAVVALRFGRFCNKNYRPS